LKKLFHVVEWHHAGKKPLFFDMPPAQARVNKIKQQIFIYLKKFSFFESLKIHF